MHGAGLLIAQISLLLGTGRIVRGEGVSNFAKTFRSWLDSPAIPLQGFGVSNPPLAGGLFVDAISLLALPHALTLFAVPGAEIPRRSVVERGFLSAFQEFGPARDSNRTVRDAHEVPS